MIYNIILNTLPKAAPLSPVNTQYLPQLPASGTVLRITLYLNDKNCLKIIFYVYSVHIAHYYLYVLILFYRTKKWLLDLIY